MSPSSNYATCTFANRLAGSCGGLALSTADGSALRFWCSGRLSTCRLVFYRAAVHLPAVQDFLGRGRGAAGGLASWHSASAQRPGWGAILAGVEARLCRFNNTECWK